MTSTAPAHRAIDWQAIHAALERQSMDTRNSRTPSEVARILRARAEALAQPRREKGSTRASQVVVFSLDGERYAIASTQIVAVRSLDDLVPLPGTPAFVLGLTTHRGGVVAVLDLRRLFDIAAPDRPTSGASLVAVTAGTSTFGLLADTIERTAHIHGDLLPPPEKAGGSFIRGLTPELIGVLDVEGIARDPRIIVNDDTV